MFWIFFLFQWFLLLLQKQQFLCSRPVILKDMFQVSLHVTMVQGCYSLLLSSCGNYFDCEIQPGDWFSSKCGICFMSDTIEDLKQAFSSSISQPIAHQGMHIASNQMCKCHPCSHWMLVWWWVWSAFLVCHENNKHGTKIFSNFHIFLQCLCYKFSDSANCSCHICFQSIKYFVKGMLVKKLLIKWQPLMRQFPISSNFITTAKAELIFYFDTSCDIKKCQTAIHYKIPLERAAWQIVH